MTRKDAERFLAEARRRLDAAPAAAVPAAYLQLVESHFHLIDRQRSRVPLWPCNLDLVPAPAIRAAVGPAAFRLFNFGLAEHFWLIRHVCGFRGDRHLLDVGCGCGKTALALLRLIRRPGSYTGFDIQPNLVAFANRLFEQLGKSDHFHADCFPIDNSFYRGTGPVVRPEEFEFPYEANRFDCAVLFSVFTHLRSEGVANYVRNLARVVRPGGRMLVSAFLLENAPDGRSGGEPWADSSRRRALAEPPDSCDRGRLRVLKPDNPEYMVAYHTDYLTSLFALCGCEVVGEPLWGSWSGCSDFYGYQDYMVFRKPGPR